MGITLHRRENGGTIRCYHRLFWFETHKALSLVTAKRYEALSPMNNDKALSAVEKYKTLSSINKNKKSSSVKKYEALLPLHKDTMSSPTNSDSKEHDQTKLSLDTVIEKKSRLPITTQGPTNMPQYYKRGVR